MKRIGLRRCVSIGLGAAIFALSAVSAAPVAAGAPPPPPPAPTRYAVTPTPVHQDVSPPLASLQPKNYDFQSSARGNDRGSKPLPRHGNAPATGAAASPSASSTSAPTAGVNFDGIGVGLGSYAPCCAPPDTNASVGPNHIVEIVNLDLAVFNKATGATLYGPVHVNTLWSGFGGGCQTDNDGDPTALYDPIANRWLFSQFAVTTTHYLNCVAISTTPDPTGPYFRYSYSYPDFPDYPKFGIWPDAYYVTFNMFAGASTFSGGVACGYDRSKMLTGAVATQKCFNVGTNFGGLLASTVNGSTPPPAGSPNYVLALDTPATSTRLAYWKFHVNFTTPSLATLTGPTFLTVPSYTNSCATLPRGDCIPEFQGTNLESLADRLMYRLNYRNLGDHQALVVNHTIVVGSGSNLHSGVRWYEIRPDASNNLTLFQQGTYSPDTNWRWMGSINMDQSGNIAMGYSVSSPTIHPQIHYTGRLVGDASGTMTQGENVIIDGTGSQFSDQNGGLARWGDYSSMAVDPVDDCTFFYANEYLKANGAFNWSTRIASFKLPGCPAPTPDFGLAVSPSSQTVARGTSTTYTVTVAPTNGFNGAVQLSGGGLPAEAAATFSPNPATSTSTMTVTTSSTTPTGSSTITVTGTNGSLSHSATTTLVVTALWVAGYTIGATPTNWGGGQMQSYSVTITNLGTQIWAVGGGNPVHLGVHFANSGGGYPNNTWYTDQRISLPADLAGGASVTLTISVIAPANSGSMVLEYQVIKEGQFWFNQFADVNVTLGPPFWAATYSVGGTPVGWVSGQTQSYSVNITNTGSQTWSAGGGNPVHLGVHFANAGGGAGSNTWYTDQRISLPADLAAGVSVTLIIGVSAPANRGSIVIEYQMVNELQFWFSQFADVNVTVGPPPWVATYSVGGTPTSWGSGQMQSYSVTITNTGSQTWSAGGSNPVHLGVHFANSGGGYPNNTWYTDQRISLPADLAGGASVTLTISVIAPANSGSMVLEYQVIKEGQFWFNQFADVNVTLGPPFWAATYSVGGTPVSWVSGQTQSYSVTITNTGSQTWSAGGGNPIHLGVHFANAGGGYPNNTWYTDQRISLPADLAGGASVTLTISVTPPANIGSLVLEYQMVKEGQFWFSQFNDVNVTVS